MIEEGRKKPKRKDWLKNKGEKPSAVMEVQGIIYIKTEDQTRSDNKAVTEHFRNYHVS